MPNSLQPDVLNLDACPDCVTFPNADDGLGYWKDSKGQSGADKTKKKKKNAANSARVAVLSSGETLCQQALVGARCEIHAQECVGRWQHVQRPEWGLVASGQDVYLTATVLTPGPACSSACPVSMRPVGTCPVSTRSATCQHAHVYLSHVQSATSLIQHDTCPTQVTLLHVSFVLHDADELDSCSFDVEEEGRYCANGYVAFVGSCRGDYQSNLTATSTQQKRRKTVTTEKEWSPATDATAPFTVVLISRPFGDPEEAADCSTLPYQTYFTISRDEVDFDSQMLWKNREITLYSYEAGFALDLLYGSSIPW